MTILTFCNSGHLRLRFTAAAAVIGLCALSACASAAQADKAAQTAPVIAPVVAPDAEVITAKTDKTKGSDGHALDTHAAAPSASEIDDGEPRPYDETRDAQSDVDATLFAAQTAKKNAIIVMGANWCHDSRALAGHFMTPRFQNLFAQSYEYVYVDMGIRNRNLDIASQFGVKKVEGTPTVIITDMNGKVLNGQTAKTWRDAASRTEDEIYEEFLSYAVKDGADKKPSADVGTQDMAKPEPKTE